MRSPHQPDECDVSVAGHVHELVQRLDLTLPHEHEVPLPIERLERMAHLRLGVELLRFATGHKAAGVGGACKLVEHTAREQGRTLLQSWAQHLDPQEGEKADDLLALSMEIARQLVRQTVAAKPDVVLAVIREALDQMPLLHAAIRLNPEDASLARLRAGDQLTHAGHRIHEDPKLKRGDVIIEAGGSHLDASLASRWRRVVEALGQDAPWIDITGET